jgi:hypothetical protein
MIFHPDRAYCQAMRVNGLFAALLALFLGACDPRLIRDGEVTNEDGSILYMPKQQPSIHPVVHSPIFTFPYEIRDDATGYSLTQAQVGTVRLDGMDGWFTQWKLDRSKAHQPNVIFLTRNRQDRVPGTPPWAEVVEISHAKIDGYLPLDDALYPDDLPLGRVAGMLNIYGLKEGSHARMYLDNRVPNRPRFEAWARERMRLPYLLANFEGNPLRSEYARLYLPAAGSAKFDSATKTAVAADGSRLHSDNRYWNTGLDRSGVRDRIHATWFAPTGGEQVRITMVPMRGYRKGYGESRVVQVIIDGTPPKRGIEDAGTPDGKSLADLINVTVPIAAEHAGHMVVVDDRTYPGEIR